MYLINCLFDHKIISLAQKGKKYIYLESLYYTENKMKIAVRKNMNNVSACRRLSQVNT